MGETIMTTERMTMEAAAAAERARFFVYAYNTTTLVTTAGLALGIFFLVTAIALYAYYYSGANDSKDYDRGGWERDGGAHAIPDTTRLAAGVLGLLEEAWAGYGVEEQACRRRLSCEASLWASQGVNMPSAVLLSGLIGQVTYEDVAEAGGNVLTEMWELRQAAAHGGRDKDCRAYEHDCPQVSIASLPKIV